MTSANGGFQLSACSEYLYTMAHSICLNVVGDCVWECFRPRILACLSIAGQSGPLCTGTVVMPMNWGIACRKLRTKWAEKDGYCMQNGGGSPRVMSLYSAPHNEEAHVEETSLSCQKYRVSLLGALEPQVSCAAGKR